MKNTQKKSGFTLQEMLISITIFMIFIGVAAGSYVSIVKSNKKAEDSQKIYNETRIVFDSLADEIRGGKIDFSCLDPMSSDYFCADSGNPAEKRTLAILKNGGESRVIFRYDETAKKLLKLKQNAVSSGIIGGWQPAEWFPVTSEKFPLNNLSFKIFPQKDPYLGENAFDDALQFQPSVQIKMTAGAYTFRTVYASRVYGKQSIYGK